MEIEKLPFAEFLEGTISLLARSEPEMIVIAAKRPDGAVLTGKWQAYSDHSITGGHWGEAYH